MSRTWVKPITPVVMARTRSMPRYSGENSTIVRSGSGYVVMGKNVPLNRNSGRVTTNSRSRPCHERMKDTATSPAAAVADPTSGAKKPLKMTIQPRRKMNRLRSRMWTLWRLPKGSTRVTAEPVIVVGGAGAAISDHQALLEGAESEEGADRDHAQDDREVDAQ